MDFEDFIMPEKQTALQQIKKLDEERTKLLESAKAAALARAEEAINELTALGFDYELVEPARATARKTRTARKAIGGWLAGWRFSIVGFRRLRSMSF